MQSSEPSSRLVASSRQAAAFSNPLRVRVLMACALEACTLSALHTLTEAPLAKLHYHVSRLLELKLLEVSRTQRRAGRAIRFYRAVAESFILPQDRLPALPGERLSNQLRQALMEEQGRSGELSLHYTTGPRGKVLAKLQLVSASAPSRALELWRTAKLNADQRASLAQELNDVLQRHASAEPGPGAEPLLVHAAFAPRLSKG